eukprot:5899176-Amphidinium_carterae.1
MIRIVTCFKEHIVTRSQQLILYKCNICSGACAIFGKQQGIKRQIDAWVMAEKACHHEKYRPSRNDCKSKIRNRGSTPTPPQS